MKAYLSGPITGVSDYKKAFAKAEQKYIALGYDVVNPANEPDPGDRPWAEWVIHDLKLMLDCECVIMLEGYEKSTGAAIEKLFARGMAIDIFMDKS